MKILRKYLFLLLFLLTLPGAHSQQTSFPAGSTPGNVGQELIEWGKQDKLFSDRDLRESKSSQQLIPYHSDSDNNDIGEQQILKRIEQWQAFILSANAALFHTDNVALGSTAEQNDHYMTASLGLSYQPRITKTLLGEFSINQSVYRYDEFRQLDFDGLSMDLGLVLSVPKLANSMLFIRYSYDRLTDTREHHEFYTSHAISFGIHKIFSLSKAHYFYLGASYDLSIDTVPLLPQRDQFSIYGGYSLNITRSIRFAASHKSTFYDYRSGGREDWNHLYSLSANYYLTKWFYLTASAALYQNDSNLGIFNYEAINYGLGLGVQVKF